MDDQRIATFLDRIHKSDGTPPLSDAKVEQLGNAERMMSIEEADEVVAVGVAARHEQPGGSYHWAVETALVAGLRFQAFESRLLEAALALVPVGESRSVWSHRSSMDAALVGAGFASVRELAHFTVALPLEHSGNTLETRTFLTEDASDVIALNRAAFSSHREAASLDETELQGLVDRDGLGPEGFLIAEEDGEVIGFCWTRVHGDGDGEIYRIAVAPDRQGEGLGRKLLAAGLEYLANHPDVSRGTLWVDLGNKTAVELYRSIGMTQDLVNREFEGI